MTDERRGSERSRRIETIKRQGRGCHGRGVPLPGLWSCRMAAGLTQRELAMLVGSSQGTITSLETLGRGAFPRTLRRLCAALEVAPSDLLCAEPED